MNTFRVLSALLTYPTGELVSLVSVMKQELQAEGILRGEDVSSLEPLFFELASVDIYDLQARYVELFDQYRALSLHLFEHVHGESRDRGQAMVSLLERYREAGLDLRASELPDFLPVFLEYLSQLPREEACAELGEAVAVIATLTRRL
ncbi:MAG TPA: nitrate reductase molybdenum cofactor assembly chaperone, partial [Spirochaetia bacterium]|nr:nitrate reductase molybdenum cofactor assembly chaperone [Spirochaetia bacterium]